MKTETKGENKAEGMERLRFMLGDWNIQSYIMGIDGEWQDSPLPTQTKIEPLLGGAFHQEALLTWSGEKQVNYFFIWSYDKYRQVFRMISCDDTGLMDVLEGAFEGNTVTISNVNTGTSILSADGSQSFIRLSSTKTSENGFIDELHESFDAGASWSPIFRAVHCRK